jgi:hypothetical protein
VAVGFVTGLAFNGWRPVAIIVAVLAAGYAVLLAPLAADAVSCWGCPANASDADSITQGRLLIEIGGSLAVIIGACALAAAAGYGVAARIRPRARGERRAQAAGD